MEIIINNYGLKFTCYQPHENTITLGLEFHQLEKELSSIELSKYVSESLTHEFLHSLLKKDYNDTVSKLFDAIEHFIGDFDFKKRIFSIIPGFDTWQSVIQNEGFEVFMAGYCIDKHDINQAFIITGGK